VDARSALTVVARAELTVGALAIGIHAVVMEFRLLVNVDLAGADFRDQPSGTFSWKCPAGEWYVTYTVVSGMSPGGLFSAGTGAWAAGL
jgi:hypothetical protein